MISWKKIINSIVFLIIGIFLFWFVYKDIEISEIRNSLGDLKMQWIVLSFLLGLLSHYFRAIRWKMLIESMNYSPKKFNLFLSVLILYFTNLIIPRGGEVARCGIISKYEKIPFLKLIGSVFIERLTDLLAFFVIFLIVLIWQFGFIKEVLSAASISASLPAKSKIFIAIGALFILVLFFFLIRKMPFLSRLRIAISRLKAELIDGLTGIRRIKNPFAYITYTFVIFFLWLLMLYVVFFSYAPTNGLSFSAAVLTYTVGTLAYLLPIQAGIGAWHFLVIQCLFLFGLNKEYGMVFALIAHTFTNLIYLVFGAVGFILLPIINHNKPKSIHPIDS